jgi:hypothetical protein
MPDEWLQDIKIVERSFFYHVLLVMAEDYVVQLVKDVKRQREIRRAGGDNQPRQLQVADDWIQAMMVSDYQSSKYCPQSHFFSLLASRARNPSLMMCRRAGPAQPR